MYVNISLDEQNNQSKRKMEPSQTQEEIERCNRDKKPKIRDNLSSQKEPATHGHSLQNNTNTANNEEPVITLVTKSYRPLVNKKNNSPARRLQHNRRQCWMANCFNHQCRKYGPTRPIPSNTRTLRYNTVKI